MSDNRLRFTHPSFGGLIGVARRDITPPVGIYARQWGAATNDVADGIHRPLTATALVMCHTDGGLPMALLALDLGWWKQAEDEWRVRGRVIDQLGVDESRVVVSLSHTHAAPSTSTADVNLPGGELIAPYLDKVADAAAAATQEALERAEAATLSWSYGTCTLAVNRDLFDGSRHACGFNPQGEADATVLIGRATNARGATIATIVNYACHPTTLAWQNRLISPDFIGGMREVLERETGGALSLFLQGASGEFGSREMYTGDTAVPDRHGKTLAYSVLSALNEMLPHNTALRYTGVVESGAELATWAREEFEPQNTLNAAVIETTLPLKASWNADEPEPVWGEIPTRVLEERMRRRHRLRDVLDGGRLRVWLWRLGDALLIAQPNECYSWFQRDVRRQFPDTTVAVLNVANGGSRGYLPTAETYDLHDLYQVWQTPYERGSLEQLRDAVDRGIREQWLNGTA